VSFSTQKAFVNDTSNSRLTNSTVPQRRRGGVLHGVFNARIVAMRAKEIASNSPPLHSPALIGSSEKKKTVQCRKEIDFKAVA
jgi:hypothetical protein